MEPMLSLIKDPGRPQKVPRRDIADAIVYVMRTGCSWRQLPADFPPWETVYGQYRRWEWRRVTERIVDCGRRSRSRPGVTRCRRRGPSTRSG
ncbi:transposase [Micromonospora sp. LOL_023]|uniref:transposase n=1 Tax=Micromonospora sp. LOL_023 TaxID=3345418 RepID=UPI003A859206